MVDFEAADAPSQYSEESARALRGAGETLIEHLRSYLEIAVSAAGPADQPGLVDPTDELMAAAAAFDRAHFDHLGVGGPVGEMDDLEDDDDDFDEEEIEEEIGAGQGISMLTRQDFVVPDPDRIIAAGRAAYLKTWPDDRPVDAEHQVSNLGLALYELIHNGGRGALDHLETLHPTASDHRLPEPR